MLIRSVNGEKRQTCGVIHHAELVSASLGCCMFAFLFNVYFSLLLYSQRKRKVRKEKEISDIISGEAAYAFFQKATAFGL